MTAIQKIEHLVGTVSAFDGKMCVWALGRPHDLRDILRNVKGLSLAEAQEALEQADAGRPPYVRPRKARNEHH